MRKHFMHYTIDENQSIQEAFVSMGLKRVETLYPYEQMNSNSVFVTDMGNVDYRFLVHGGFPFVSVGVKFKRKMLETYINKHTD